MSSKQRFGQAVLLAAAVSGGVVGLGYGLRRFLRRTVPLANGRQMLAGLQRPIEVIRDPWGVPHIYAQTNADLFFGQGYVHAQDRLFQMDVNRRLGTGRVSEIVGPAGIPTDRLARILGWPLAAEALAGGILNDPETRLAAEAYAAGVNAFLGQGRLPAEFTLLAYQPEPWQPFHSAAWGTVLAWGLSVNWETELMRAILIERLGPEKVADLTPLYDRDYPTILPAGETVPAGVGNRLATAMLDAYRQAVHQLPLGGLPIGDGIGSNNWVVNGQWTTTGRPILANDPHLPPLFPTLWYENHLCGGDYHVTGFTTPGVPGVLIGHNESLAWGVTNAFPDVQDIYLERFHPHDPQLYAVNGQWVRAEVRREEIRVRGRRKPLVEEVRYTRHGPVISGLIPDEPRTFALRWASYEPNNHLRAVLEMCRANDLAMFRAALRHWSFPSQNVVYADVAGNVGYMMPGRVPLRARGEGLVPVPGHNDAYEWQGWIPFEELPARHNPMEGFIVTANNRMTGDGYPHLLTGEWQPPYRAQRIAALLQQAAPLSLADHGRIQNDTVSLLARRFMNSALPLLLAEHAPGDRLADQALILLQQWHQPPAEEGHNMHPGRVGPGLYFGWLVQFVRATMHQALGAALADDLLGRPAIADLPAGPFHEIATELAVRWLETEPPAWVGPVRPLLQPAFRQAVAVLRAHFGPNPAGWAWGNLHQVPLHGLLTRLPGLGRLWKPINLPLGGDGYTVNQADCTLHFPPDPVKVIASARLLLDVGGWDNCLSSLPGGQSGHLASPHYQDGVVDWQQGRYHPMLFSRAAVQQVAAATLWLTPEE
ncbi:MAG: penicillin acylase family protein [Ardenticatenaceae bacterium]|nr:penicillin acylase family protein [Ardenticatenaceae bacterium]